MGANFQLIMIPADKQPRDVVVLSRVEAGRPEHCVHGKATCRWCRDWLWLGSRSVHGVSTGALAPICESCARTHFAGQFPTGNIGDQDAGHG